MLPALFVFVVVAGAVIGAAAAVDYLPGMLARRRMERRLHDVSFSPSAGFPSDTDGETVVKAADASPVPILDRAVAATRTGFRLTRIIEQSGVRTTPGVIVASSVVLGGVFALLAYLFVHVPYAPLVAAAAGLATPTVWLMQRRSARLKRYEEQFPEALDLLSRAIRAGHAFQTAMGMVADELPAPVGPEFKKTFDRQNFGLPLRDALNEMSDRVGLIDTRFFVIAVLIQRETGGNLSEILENLAHVVRERFKILRQVRVYTAHGRLTGYVLLALPAFLAIALAFINPEHMQLLFRERLGHMLLASAVVMQTIGYIWIKQVVKIEV
jgi:tight adherence protein B